MAVDFDWRDDAGDEPKVDFHWTEEDEQKHPRDKGRFAEKNSGPGVKQVKILAAHANLERKLTNGLQGSMDSFDDPKTTADFSKAILHIVTNMPSLAAERADKGVSEFRFHETIDGTEMALVDSILSRIGKTRETVDRLTLEKVWQQASHCGGFYSPSTKIMHADGRPEKSDSLSERMTGYQRRSVLAHELMHAIDYGGELKPTFSRTGEWMECYRSEYAARMVRDGIKFSWQYPLTQYACTDPEEAFAEFGRTVYASDMPLADIEREFPDSTRFFKEKGLWPDSKKSKPDAEPEEIFNTKIPLPEGHADAKKPTTKKEQPPLGGMLAGLNKKKPAAKKPSVGGKKPAAKKPGKKSDDDSGMAGNPYWEKFKSGRVDFNWDDEPKVDFHWDDAVDE